MSDMETKVVTYTLRDLNRRPAKVLSACDAEGEVEIRTRSGKTYSLRVKEEPSRKPIKLPDFEARRRRLRDLGFKGPRDPEEIERIERNIAGEE